MLTLRTPHSIVYYKSDDESISEPVLVTEPNGFDTLTQERLLRIGGTGFKDRYKFGDPHPEYPNMYCTGPQGGGGGMLGFAKVNISWRGIAGDIGEKSGIESFAISTRETPFPVESTASDGGPWTTWYPIPGGAENGKINRNTGTYYRVRLINRIWSVTQKGVVIGTKGQAPPLPAPPPNRPPEATNPYKNLPDGERTVVNGVNIDQWVLRNYQPVSEFSAGEKALFLWSAYWEWVWAINP